MEWFLYKHFKSYLSEVRICKSVEAQHRRGNLTEELIFRKNIYQILTILYQLQKFDHIRNLCPIKFFVAVLDSGVGGGGLYGCKIPQIYNLFSGSGSGSYFLKTEKRGAILYYEFAYNLDRKNC